MKRFVFALLFFCITTSLFAQDVITKKDGTDIQATIMEVTSTEIKYKKYNNLSGPIFTLPKSEILIIRYENGEKEVLRDEKPANKIKLNTTKPITVGMKYHEYKKFYDTKKYVPRVEDPISVGWSGVASFFVTGLGQGVAGEWGRGACFFVSHLALTGLALAFVDSDFLYVALAAGLGVNIWSIVDAIHVAKVKNMYYQDIRTQQASLEFKVEPYLTFTPTGALGGTNPVAGLSIKLVF